MKSLNLKWVSLLGAASLFISLNAVRAEEKADASKSDQQECACKHKKDKKGKKHKCTGCSEGKCECSHHADKHAGEKTPENAETPKSE